MRAVVVWRWCSKMVATKSISRPGVKFLWVGNHIRRIDEQDPVDPKIAGRVQKRVARLYRRKKI